MKKNTLQKVLATALCATMVAGCFAGCGDDATSTASSTASTETSTSVENNIPSVEEVVLDESVVTGMDGWSAFENTVTLQIPVYDRGGEVDVTNNYWTQWVQSAFGDTYNINVEYVAIPRGDVLNAYAQLGNAGTLPTILMEYDFDKQAQWADDGYLQEVDLEQFATVAPTYYQMMIDNNNLNNTALNGTTYFVLAERPFYNNTYNYVTFYRADWLEELGLSYPKTYAESLEVYQALVDGGYCEYPLGGSKVTGAGVDQNYAYREYPQDELEWATTGGYAIPALSTAATKKLIERQNELYNLGYINPDFITREATDNEADFVAGNMFTYSCYIAPSIQVLTDFYAQNPDAKLAIAYTDGLVVDDEGVSNAYRPNNPFGMMISFSSLASDDEVLAAEMYLEWLIQDENLFYMQYGEEGITFQYVDGLATRITENIPDEYAMANNNKDYYCAVIESYKIDNIEDNIKANCPAGYPDSDDFYDQILANYNGMVALADSGYIQSDCMFAVAISAVTDNQASLLSLYEEYREKLTICDPSEFDALYEEYSQAYLDNGYQAIIDERAEAYNNGMTTHLPDGAKK